MKLLLDVTRANPNTETQLVERAKAAHPTVDAHDIIIFRQAHQTQADSGSQELVLPSGTHFALVASWILEKLRQLLSDPNPPDQIDVFSFHRAVFELSSQLPGGRAAYVRFRSFSSLWQDRSTISAGQQSSLSTLIHNDDTVPRPVGDMLHAQSLPPKPSITAAQAFRWPTEMMSIEAAVRVLETALREISATDISRAVRQSDVRSHLARVDPRFDKSNPLASASGLISALVRAAESRDTVVVSREDPINPRIWLSDKEGSKELRRTAALPIARYSRSRSQEFLDILRAAKLGPFSNIRKHLYEALDAILASGPISVSELLKKTVDVTRARVEALDQDASRYPWRHVRAFLTELLVRRPILRTAGGLAIAPSFTNLATSITGIDSNWRTQLDGELAVALVSAGLDIRLVDVPALAGALYFDRSDQTEAEMATVISYLLTSGRLVESQDELHRLQLPFSYSSVETSSTEVVGEN